MSAVVATQPTEQAAVADLLVAPTIEQAHLLLGACADFSSASRLLCVNKHWAASVAGDDSSWSLIAPQIAREARLHYEPPSSASHGGWRDACAALFAARGTFVSSFGGLPTPPPELAPFAIAVGCRFRPPGPATSEPEHGRKEMVLPLHQRLRLIQSSHHCSLAEARRILWSGEESSARSPWATSAAAALEVVDEAAATKENRPAGAEPGPTEAAAGDASCAGGGDADGGGDAAAAAGGGTESAAGLIGVRDGSAIVCAPGAGIRAFDFAHAWDERSTQREVYEAAAAPLVSDVLNGRSACVLAYGQVRVCPRAGGAWGACARCVPPLMCTACACAACGQTGSGKTFTMSGAGGGRGGAADEDGLVPRAVRAVLEAREAREAALGVSSKVTRACTEHAPRACACAPS